MTVAGRGEYAAVAERFGFDSAFLQELERLALQSRRPQIGPLAGPRRSPQHGSSVEFADFRPYLPGDDFRRIDWNAYARLDRLFSHLYSAEQMTTLTLYLDCSVSMGFGLPTKGLTAARLAAILSFLGLHHYDRVGVVGWSSRIISELAPLGGRTAIGPVWQCIADTMLPASLEALRGGATDCGVLRDHLRRRRHTGLGLVISDFLTESDWQGALRALQAAGQEVSVVQILAPDELEPELEGDWELRDAESGQRVEVTISPYVLRRYREELAAHTAALETFCRRQGVAFLQLPSDALPVGEERPAAGQLLAPLRRAGIVG